MLAETEAILSSVAMQVVLASCKATLVIAFVLLVRKVLAMRLSARARHGLWLAVIASLLLPWGFDLPVELRREAPVMQVPHVDVQGAQEQAGDVRRAMPAEFPQSVAETGTSALQPVGAGPPIRSTSFRGGLALLWAVVAAALAMMVLANLYRYRCIVARARPMSGAAWELLQECRTLMALRREVQLLESADIALPAVFGWLSPTLLLPPGLHERLGEARLRHVLLHELAHVQRHDILTNWLAAGAQILHWFNPVVWYGMRVMRLDMEQACDARVLEQLSPQEHADYGHTLLGVFEACPGRVPAQALGVVESQAQLKERITMIAKFSSRKIRSPILGAVLLLGLASVAVTQPRIEAAASASGTAISEARRMEAPVRMAQAAQPVPAAAPAPISQRAAEPDRPEPASRVVVPFTVRIIPPDTTRASEASKEFLDRYFRGLGARLRAVPGLTLLTPESPGRDGDVINYEIGVEAGFIEQIGIILQIGLSVKSLAGLPDNNSGALFGGSMFTMMSKNRFEDSDPELLLDRDVDSLRVRTFPSDPNFLRELQARIADPRVESRLRQLALHHLLLPYIVGPSRSVGAVDPTLIRAGVAFATTAPETVERRVAWRELRDTRSPELVDPLIQALRTEKDDDVRLFLATGVVRTYIADPRIRAALESVARSDSRPLIRMAAQHELSGDGSWKEAVWNDYVLATLKNPQLSDTQRLEPFAYLELCGEFPPGQPPLDDEAIRILGSLLARAKSESTAVSGAISLLGRVRTPAAYELMTGLLQVSRNEPKAIPSVRDHLLALLSERARSAPDTRALVQDIAARDPDVQVRGRARMMLDLQAVAAAQAK